MEAVMASADKTGMKTHNTNNTMSTGNKIIYASTPRAIIQTLTKKPINLIRVFTIIAEKKLSELKPCP